MSSPPVVAFVAGEYPPDRGGVGDYTRCLAHGLAHQGARVHVLRRRHASSPATTDPDRAQAADEAVTVHDVLRGAGPGLLADVAEWSRSHDPDVIHVQYQAGAFDLQGWICCLPRWLEWSTRQRTTAAFTYHDLKPPYLLPKANGLRDLVLFDPVRSADLVVTTNPEDTATVATREPVRHVEIPIGSNLTAAPAPSPTMVGADHRHRRRPVNAGDATAEHARGRVVTFGLTNASKGLLDLVDAVAELRGAGRDVELVIVGGTPGASDPTDVAHRRTLQDRVAQHGLTDRVHWTGHLPEAEAGAWLADADVVAQPYADGASLRRGSLMAAWRYAAPVVSTTPAPAAVGPEMSDALLTVPAGDPAALAAALGRVLDDPDLAGALRAGSRRAAERFDWEVIVRAHLEAYRAAEAGPR